MNCVYCLKVASDACTAISGPCRTVESFKKARSSPKEVIDHLVDGAQAIDLISLDDMRAALDRINKEAE